MGSDSLVLGAVVRRCGAWEVLEEEGDEGLIGVEPLRTAGGKYGKTGCCGELSRVLQTYCEGGAGAAEVGWRS